MRLCLMLSLSTLTGELTKLYSQLFINRVNRIFHEREFTRSTACQTESQFSLAAFHLLSLSLVWGTTRALRLPGRQRALSRFLDRVHVILTDNGRHLDINTSGSSHRQLTLPLASARASSPALRPAPHCAGANRRAVPVYSPGRPHSGMSRCHIPRGSSQPSL